MRIHSSVQRSCTKARKSSEPSIFGFAFRQIAALTLVGTFLVLSVPPVLARGSAQRSTASSELSPLANLALASLNHLFGKTSAAGQESGMPAQEEQPPAEIAPVEPPTEAELQARVASIEVNPQSEAAIEKGKTLVLAAVPLDLEGNAVQGLVAGWTSSNSAIVSVTTDGQATAVEVGTAQLTATAGSRSATVNVTVTATSATIERGKLEIAGNGSHSEKTGRAAIHQRKQTRLSHGAKMVRAALQVDYFDEDRKRFTSEVGAPPGRTEPGAPTPPAAIPGTEKPGSSNFNFQVPVASLPGRGIDVDLSLIYNSQLWNKKVSSTATTLTYDRDAGWPGPGFSLGYGKMTHGNISGPFTPAYTVIDPDGTRHVMEPQGGDYTTATEWNTTDGTFIYFNETNATAVHSDGTRVQYGAYSTIGTTSFSYPTRITDRNGNYILISYVGGVGPRISTIQDTLGRYVRFYYDTANDLVAVTVPGYAGAAELQTIRFYYQNITINPAGSFTGMTISPSSATSKRVLQYVYFPGTQAGYRYDYSAPYGMIYRTNQLRNMTVSTTLLTSTGSVTSAGQVAAWTEYDYKTVASSLTDAPTYTKRTDEWAGRTSGMGVMTAAPYYTFEVTGTTGKTSTITAPDGSVSETLTSSEGLVTETSVKTNTGVLLAKTAIVWGADATGYNNRPDKVKTTNEAGQTRTISYSYAAYGNNPSIVREYDFDTAVDTPGPELRRTETTYEEGISYVDYNRRLLHLPKSVKVFAGGATAPSSYVKYDYDQTSLTSLAGIIMYDPAYDPSSASYNAANAKRGNVTTVTAYADAAPTTPTGANVNTSTYDIAGNAITQTLNCCQQKTITYSSTYKYAYPTQEVKGTSPTQLTTQATYDFNTGLVRTTKDVDNNQTTTIHYESDTLRHFKTINPDGGYTQTDYGDALYADPDAAHMHSYVKTSTLIDSPGGVERLNVSYQYMDGRGAVARTFSNLTAANGYQTTDVEYDEMGRAERTSNPYFSAGAAAAITLTTGPWTTVTRDLLGRVTEVTLPDSNKIKTGYAGDTITVTDQAGKQRRQITDALGRVERVDEPDATSSLGTAAAPVQATSYTYDALDNLVKIMQGAQTRYFKYDSLGHLTYKRDVEQSAPHTTAVDPLTGISAWSTRIVYDTQGRITDTYDARNVRAQYAYDGLNRVTGITYSGETTTTPRVVYTYDQAQTGYFNKGRLTRVETISGTSTVQTAHDYDYDLMGRVVKQQQSTLTSVYNLSYGYNLAGQLISETYPSNRVVSYKYDEGMRLSEVRDAGQIYANGYTYFAHGGLSSEAWNNGSVYSLTYNNRLQPTQIKLTIGGVEKQRYDYLYGQVTQITGAVDATKNTGQVARIEGFINGVRQWQQRFSYDTLGRLDIASEYRGDVLTTKVYESNYDYDRWGNRMQVAASNPSVLLPYWEVKTTDVDTTNNRIKSVTGATMTYDAAGNLTVDGKFRGRKYQYDANDRQRQSTLLNDTDLSTAMHDGAGQRVQTTSGGVTRNLVYDIFGQVVAEYEGGILQREHIYRGGLLATREAAGAVQYVMADHQGSTRLVTDQAGAPISRHDYLAFGEEIGSGVGMRTSAQGYGGADSVSQQYARMEKDDATGLDHTWWRKYEQRGGRWTSPDPYGGSMSIGDPQSFNRYAYVGNDPVNLIDPSGLEPLVLLDGVEVPRGMWGMVYGMWASGAADITPIGGRRSYYIDGIGRHRQDERNNILRAWDVLGFMRNTSQQEQPCPPVPQAPAGADINANIQTMEQSLENARHPPDVADIGGGAFRGGVGAGHISGFAGRVMPGGPWDYKQRDVAGGSFIPFGNFNYGAAGAAAGFSEGQLLRAAGFVQKWFGDSEGDGGSVNIINALTGTGGQSPFQDQDVDQENIKLGILYYRRGCHNR
jgi:RHS repeat-associated protein